MRREATYDNAGPVGCRCYASNCMDLASFAPFFSETFFSVMSARIVYKKTLVPTSFLELFALRTHARRVLADSDWSPRNLQAEPGLAPFSPRRHTYSSHGPIQDSIRTQLAAWCILYARQLCCGRVSFFFSGADGIFATTGCIKHPSHS